MNALNVFSMENHFRNRLVAHASEKQSRASVIVKNFNVVLPCKNRHNELAQVIK